MIQIAKSCTWPDTARMIAHFLALHIEKQPKPVNDILSLANTMPPSVQKGVLLGLREAFQGWRKVPKPAAWDAYVATAVPRSVPEVIRELEVLFGDGRAMQEIKRVVLDAKADPRIRQQALQTLIDSKPPDLRSICEAMLDVRGLNMTAARGLAQFDDPAVARRLIQAYRKFQVSERPALLDALVSRPSFAKELLSNLGPSKIPREDLGAFHARQIRSLQDPVLDKMLVEAWGELRDSPAEKKGQMAELRQKLTPSVISRANLSQGRALYQKACASCHMMYGEGQKVGPDLTGSGRGNMDYLLENIIDPGAVVPADYRMSVVALNDGRVLTGLVMAKNKQTLTLREPSETRTIAMADVEVIKVSTASLMPDGLLQTLTPDQVRDLFAYMMHQGQVPLP